MNADPTTAASGGLSDKLKPCPNPWCISTTAPFAFKLDRHGWRIECGCGVRTFSQLSMEDAASMWNARTHPSPPSPARGEELEAGALEAAANAVWDAPGCGGLEPDECKSTAEAAIRAYFAARPSVTTDAGAVTREEIADVIYAAMETGRTVEETSEAIIARLARAPADGGEKPQQPSVKWLK